MKCLSSLMAMVVLGLGLGLAAPASAQGIAAPRYVKKAVYVRIHWDRTFYEYWKIGRRYSDAQINTLVRGYFDRARAVYATAPMQNIDLYLLEDFDRITGPMADYYDSNSHASDGDERLLNTMRSRLKTGNVQKTVPNGTTHLLGRTINIVFVHANYGGLGGAADVTIPSLGTADANAFFSTGAGQGPIVNEARQSTIDELILHELGHIFGGQHGTDNRLADCPWGGPFEIMCGGYVNLQRRFGPANSTRVANVMKSTLQRCNSAYSTVASCETAVHNDCTRILDYLQIQPCIDANILANCRDICTSTQKNARVVINSLSSPIGRNVVVAPGPGQNQ